MKTAIGLSSVLLVLAAALGQGWEWRYPLINGNSIRCIGSFDNGNVWASTDMGDLLWSSDAGETWTVRNALHGPKSEIVFVDELHGWGIDGSCGYSPDTTSLRIYYTSDGGFTWSVQHGLPHQDGAYLSDIEFVDSQNGWVIGWQPVSQDMCIQLHTDNGGTTWYDDGVEGYDCPEFASFLNAQEGWATEWPGYPLLHTANGGFTWTEVTPSCPVDRLKFLDHLHGWGLGQNDVYRTTDGGITWVGQQLDYNGWFSSSVLECVNDSVILAGGSSARIYRTTDAGANWAFHDFTSFGADAIHFTDAEHGWVAGSRGTILYTSDGIDQWELQNGSLGLYVPSSDVDFVDLNHGWAVGGDRILHTSNGGFTWVTQDTNYSEDYLFSIEAVDSLRAWICGPQYGMLHTTDGGESWTMVEPCSCYVGQWHWWRPLGIAHYGPNNLWVVGHGLYAECDTVFCRSADGGQTWDCHSVLWELPGYPHGDLVFVDENNGWMAGGNSEGYDGFITHTSDGGLTWEAQYQYSPSVLSISFADQLHGWAIGQELLSRTTNGGTTWDLLSPPTYRLAQVQFFDSLNGWLSSDQNLSFRTSDGGLTWQEFPTPLDGYAVDFVDINHGWMVGASGAVIYFDGLASSTPPRPRHTPEAFAFSTYPNPFNPVTTLSFELPVSGRVNLRVYDLTGRLVETLADRVYAAGSHSVTWNAEGMASGMYFCRMEATPLNPPRLSSESSTVNGGRSERTVKMVVLK